MIHNNVINVIKDIQNYKTKERARKKRLLMSGVESPYGTKMMISRTHHPTILV